MVGWWDKARGDRLNDEIEELLSQLWNGGQRFRPETLPDYLLNHVYAWTKRAVEERNVSAR